MCKFYKEDLKPNKNGSVRKNLRGLFAHRRIGGKKGFTLVELLVGVTALAILLPVLFEIFVFSSKLNKKANLQGRADSLAEATMEEIKAVKYEELEAWLDDNGWSVLPLDDQTAEQTKIYSAEKTIDGGLKKLTFELNKYGKDAYEAGIPKFPGFDSKDINLRDTQLLGNEQNTLSKNELISRLNVNASLKQKVWNAVNADILANNPAHVYDSSRMTISLNEALEESGLKKKTNITISYDDAHTTITAAYNVKFEYTLSSCEYTYLYYDESGKFKSKSGTFVFAIPEKIDEEFSTGAISKPYYGTYPDIQTVFISYTPLNANDEITINFPTLNNINLIFEENKILGNDDYVLNENSFTNDIVDYLGVITDTKKVIKDSSGNFAFFSSNNPYLHAPLSESVYQDEIKTWLYEAVVTAEVKGGLNETPVKATFKSTMLG